MTITKTHLKDSISNRLHLPKNQASHIFESLLEKIKETLASGEDILISGFGKFCVKEKKSRRGRNPQTGNDLILDGRKGGDIQSSSVLKGKMDGKNE